MSRFLTSYYKIADHLICIEDHVGIEIDRALPSFRPFKYDRFEITPILTIQIKSENSVESLPARKILSDISVIWEENFRFEESDDRYFTSILAKDSAEHWLMCSKKDFSESEIFLLQKEVYHTNKLSWLIMVAYGQACLMHQTLLIHSSVVENGEFAVAFLGKSGTGKSTHSRLWTEHIPDFRLLNDDNPAIRVLPDHQVMIYGTPWSGKTHCYRNKRLTLTSIIRLEQAPVNRITKKEGLLALTALLPSCSAIRWNASLFDQMVSSLELIVKQVKVGQLQCLPDSAAAELANAFVCDSVYQD